MRYIAAAALIVGVVLIAYFVSTPGDQPAAAFFGGLLVTSAFAAAIVGATSTCRDHPQCDGYATCRRCGRGISGVPQCCPVEEKP